ncbi:MAG: sodium:proton antiporter [Pyrinomonadaceae bacterium]
MDFLAWLSFVGGLLLLMALSSAYVRRLPITTSTIYLIIGLAISPAVLNLVRLNFVEWKTWFEHLTEIAVILSLFVGGLKLRLPLSNAAWQAAFRLAGPVMIASIAGVAVFSHFVFGFSWPSGVLLGAILAPTDPVLASTVSVNDSADDDRLRYALSGEAGFNDGAAFPFVVFALLWAEYGGLGDWVGGWALHRLLWAIPAGLLIGYFLGKGVGILAIWLRSRHQETDAPNDFLALALIALAYAGAEYAGAWGFLAAFAAGIGFRRAEIQTVVDNPAPEHDGETNEADAESLTDHPPAEEFVGKNMKEEDLKHPTKAAGVMLSEIISFGDTAERLLEGMMIVLVGICLAIYWDWRAVPLALALFFVIRPSAALIFLVRTPTGKIQRLMMGWFGIRGIGSLYYLSYALNHGLNENISDTVSITLSVVAISILLHGISSQPILNYYERAISSWNKH